MKYAIQVVKITSQNTQRKVWEHIISKVEIRGKSIKIKFLPTLTSIKEAIRKDIFGE